ncbi:hypothetical protein MKW98_011468 [Papaver atlanticum]|uniref:Uncharacterized protein n=1 Tax=Papaver atlanticum TaxID=357466 RepID=A0AAD4RWQ1_9MAGN|nr:hypothetical protein MKW98_011468 [Papaver atlanticum]
MNPPSSEIDADLERFRRFHPDGTLPCVPNAKNLSDEEVRGMFNIPKSVKFTKMKNPTDPVCNDEVVVNLYQLACGFPMPVDSFTCSLLNAWGISTHQMHPSLCFALKWVLSIFKTYYRFILPADIQKFITPSGRQISGLPWKVFSCECKHQNVKFLDDSSDVRIEKFFDLPRSLFDVSLSDEFDDWRYDRDLNANEISAPTHAVPLNQRPGVTVIESDSESYDSCSPKAPEMNSMGTDDLQGSSSPSSLIRIRRRHYKTKAAGANTSDAHDFGASNGKTSFKRLRKGYQPLPFTFNTSQFVIVPDAMSGKIRQAARRSKRLVNKGYTFKEAISCCPVGAFAPAFEGNRERTNSGSGDEVLGMETENSDDISSGCPSPFTDLGDAQVPLGREAVRGNDFSSTVFVDDNLTSQDNASPARDSILSPGHREPTCDNGEKVIQPPFPTDSLLDCDLFSDRGMMGSGLTNPCPKNENVRVRRPASIPQSDTGISRPAPASPSPVQPINEPDCGSLLKTMTDKRFDQLVK